MAQPTPCNSYSTLSLIPPQRSIWPLRQSLRMFFVPNFFCRSVFLSQLCWGSLLSNLLKTYRYCYSWSFMIIQSIGIGSFRLTCFVRSCLKNSFPNISNDLYVANFGVCLIGRCGSRHDYMCFIFFGFFQVANIYKLLTKEIFLIFFWAMCSANSFLIVSLSQYFLYLDGLSQAKMYKRQMSNPLISPLGP